MQSLDKENWPKHVNRLSSSVVSSSSEWIRVSSVMHTAYWRVFFKSFASYLDHHFAELLRGGTRHEFAFEERWPHIVSDFALLTTNSDGLARNLVSQQVLVDFWDLLQFLENFGYLLGPFESFWDHLSLTGIIWVIFGTIWGICGSLELFGTFRELFFNFWVLWGYFRTFWDHLVEIF